LLFCPIGLLLQPVKLKDKEDVVDSLILDQVVAKAFSHNAYKKSVYICLSIVVSYYDVWMINGLLLFSYGTWS